MIKIFFNAAITGLFLMTGTAAIAQKQEISLSAGYGLSGLKYDVKNGESAPSTGFQAGLGFTRFISSRWGIASGLKLAYYRTNASLYNHHVFPSYEVDSEGSAFEYRVITSGYKETQNLYTANIPLLLQFQTLPENKTRFYSQAGVKLAIPLTGRYKTSADAITATGYYPDENVEFADLATHGFGTQAGWKKEGDYSFKIGYALAVEAGAKFRLSPYAYLYTGGFVDYGLNNLKKEEGDAPVITYHPTEFGASRANGMFSLANTTGDIRLLAYGFKMRIAFSSGKL